MRGSEFTELKAFAAIVEEGSFVRAAARLRVSPPALSQSIRLLEARIGVRLLNRTTRSVSPTVAGEKLFARLGVAFEELEDAVAEVQSARDRPGGSLRINVPRVAAMRFVAPVLGDFQRAYPEVALTVIVDDMLTDIVEGRFDAGIRLGERLEKDMVAVKLSDDLQMAAVAAPAYLEGRAVPRTCTGTAASTSNGRAGATSTDGSFRAASDRWKSRSREVSPSTTRSCCSTLRWMGQAWPT